MNRPTRPRTELKVTFILVIPARTAFAGGMAELLFGFFFTILVIYCEKCRYEAIDEGVVPFHFVRITKDRSL